MYAKPIYMRVDTGYWIAAADKVQQEVSNWFRAKKVVNIVYLLYFYGRDSAVAKVFFDKINGTFVCFVTAAILFCIKVLITGECNRSSNFRNKST